MEVTAPGGDGGEPGISDRRGGFRGQRSRDEKNSALKIETFKNANHNVRNFCGERPIRTIQMGK